MFFVCFESEEKEIDSIISILLFLYVLSLYIFTFLPGLNNISNAIAALFILSVTIKTLMEKGKIIFNKFLLLYLLFIIVCTISYFYAEDQFIALSKIRTLILYFIFITALISYLDNYDKLIKLINFFVFSGVVAALYILFFSDIYSGERLGDLLGNENRMGIIIGMSMLFSIYFILFEKKYFYIIPAIITTGMVLFTGSRVAFVFIFIGSIFLTYFKNKNSSKGKIIKNIVILLLISFIFYYLVFNISLFYLVLGKRVENISKFIRNEEINERSISTRIYMIKFGFEMFKYKPIIGYGIGNYEVLLEKSINMKTYAHNNYIELLVDVGILGTIIYYAIYVQALLYLKKIKDYVKLKYLFLTLFLCFFIIDFASINYSIKHTYFIFAMSSVLIKLNVQGYKIRHNKIGL